MSHKKYLLLSASYGNGHNSAKNALESHLLGAGNIVQSLDLTTFFRMGGSWKGSKRLCELSEVYPTMWQAIMQLRDWKVSGGTLSKIIALFSQQDFDTYLDEYQPDHIICTFPVWSMLIENHLKNREKKFTLGVVVTDSIEISWWWYMGHDVVDNYFVIDETTKQVFHDKYGHTKDNVHVTFFPVERKYFTNKSVLLPRRFVILLSGLKDAFVQELLTAFLKEPFAEKILILQGRNETLYNKLQLFFHNERIEFYDFLDLKESLGNIDFIISKPGGALMSECIAQDVVMIAPTFIPGQEEGNIKFLEKEKLGFYEPDVEKIVTKILTTDWNEYLPNFKRVKNENAVQDIIQMTNRK